MHLLDIQDLHTYFDTKHGLIKAVNGVSLHLDAGKTLAIIGESGSGKSQTAMSILQLFTANQHLHSGDIFFDGQHLSALDAKALQAIRGNAISMVFQEPMTSLNPVFTIGRQIAEVLCLHQKMPKKKALSHAVQLLQDVKMPNSEALLKRYPHELSGGMRQRVMIAMALACTPKLLIADEPTTALDVTIQAQILRLLQDLQRHHNTAILFITHDLGVVHQIADDVAVMYCGQVVEQAPKDLIFRPITPFTHPYTHALLKSLPALADPSQHRLPTIEGQVPHPTALPPGCKFAPRCPFATPLCHRQEPPLTALSDKQWVRCFHPDAARA